MREADDRFLVTTNRLSHFQEDVHRWTGQVGSMFGIAPEHFQLVLLQGNERMSGGYRMKEVRKETGCIAFTEMKLVENLHLQLDSGRLDEWLSAQDRNAASFDPVANTLLHRLNWTKRLQQTDRPWLRRLMVHRSRTR